jgi:hypothetical protein
MYVPSVSEVSTVVVSVLYRCCKSRLGCCTCCDGLYTYISSVCSKCFICFKRTLQVFHLDVAKQDRDVAYICKCFRCFSYVYWCFILIFAMATHVFPSFFWCFVSVSDVCCKCFSYFGRTLQVFNMDVAKVDCVLHMLQCAWEVEGRERPLRAVWRRRCRRTTRACVSTQNASPGEDMLARAWKTECSTGVRLDVRAKASVWTSGTSTIVISILYT